MSQGGDPEDLLIFPAKTGQAQSQTEEDAASTLGDVDPEDIAALEELKRGIPGLLFQLEEEDVGPKRHEVILFYDPATNAADDLGTLYYCSPGSLVKSVERSLPLNQLKEMFLQKQTPIFRHAAANDVAEDCCLTLVAEDRNWSLAAKTIEDRVVWMRAIEYCLKVAGRGIEMSEDDQPDPENPNDSRNYPPEVATVIEGTYIWRYRREGKEVKKFHQFLHYRPYGSEVGGEFCMGNGMQIDERLRLADITDLYLQKQTPELLDAKDARDECCLSIIGTNTSMLHWDGSPWNLGA